MGKWLPDFLFVCLWGEQIFSRKLRPTWMSQEVSKRLVSGL